MSRLFVLGDSWAFNYFSKNCNDRKDQLPNLNNRQVALFVKEFNYFGHWTDYLTDYFTIYNFSEHGCCNEDIIHQLGFIPEYIDGDRIIIIFTNPSRYQWVINEQRRALTIGSPWQDMLDESQQIVVNNQLILRDKLWYETTQRENEKMFISKLPILYKKYNPILVSWDIRIANTIECIDVFAYNDNYKTIETESGGKYKDGHMGVVGNFEIYKFIANKLNLPIDNTRYIELTKSII